MLGCWAGAFAGDYVVIDGMDAGGGAGATKTAIANRIKPAPPLEKGGAVRC